MSYRWVDHTAELELEIDAPSEEAVFEEGLLALAELLGGESQGTESSISVSLHGSDRAALLADWLDELVFQAETEGLLPTSIQQLELRHDGLSAVVLAISGSPRPLVKGITHHRLEFERSHDGLRARLVLDV